MLDINLPNWLSNLIDQLKIIRTNPLLSMLLRITSVVYPLALMIFSWEDILSFQWTSFIWVLLASLLVCLLSLSLQNLVWSLIIDGNLSKFWINSQVYYQTVLMKRLPGGIWHWLARSSIYDSIFPDKNRSVSKSNLLEWIALFLSGFTGYLFTINSILGIASSILTIGIIARLLKTGDKPLADIIFIALGIFLLYILCWLAGGIIIHWLFLGVVSETAKFATSFAAWTLSSAISMLFFFFPSSSIIRDFSLGALLANLLEPTKGLLIILQVRVIILIADLIWSFLSLRVIKIVSTSHPKAN